MWEFLRISPGTFLMGSPAEELGRDGDSEALPFPVNITRAFYIARHPTTQAQYLAAMGTNPSRFSGDDLPVDQLRYVDALAFADRVAKLVAAPITLPTEAQWEFACRAGTHTAYYTGDTPADLDRAAWYRDNSAGAIHQVAQKESNAWGLFDMLGNIFEPCIDSIASFDEVTKDDPKGPSFPDRGTARGGGWMSSAARCRCAARMQTNDMFGGMGVRLIISP